MDRQKQKTALKQTFDTVSGGYDSRALRFFPDSARHLAGLLGLRGDEHVLDVATGSGNAAFAIAGLLPEGRVTGVDFSEGMLEQARAKAAAQNIRNVQFLDRDMEAHGFDNGGFDAAVCAFGIFFATDMDALLAHIATAVRPGGNVAVTTFTEDYFQPQFGLLFSRLEQLGVQLPPPLWKKVATDSGCRRLFDRAGLTDVRVERKNMGYYLESAEEWWDIIWNAGARSLVSQLPEETLKRFRREHLAEVESLRTDAGIWLDVGVLFTLGLKPL